LLVRVEHPVVVAEPGDHATAADVVDRLVTETTETCPATWCTTAGQRGGPLG
jgi:hypothetical protein